MRNRPIFDSPASMQQVPSTVTSYPNPSGEAHPREYLCPISLDLMDDPVILCTGHTFDRLNIETWFQNGNRTDPCTGAQLPRRSLTPNFALRDAIATYRSARTQATPPPITAEEQTQQLIYQEATLFVVALEAHIGGIEGGLALACHAAKSYVATIFGLIRKKQLGLILLPNADETCCIPKSFLPFITAIIMQHGALMLAQQHPEFCKTAIETPLNRGEGLISGEDRIESPRIFR